MADIAEDARRKARGGKTMVISPIALEMVQRIDALCEIERDINGLGADQRLAVRREFCAPLLPGCGGDRKVLIDPGTQGLLMQPLAAIGRQGRGQIRPRLGFGGDVQGCLGHQRIALLDLGHGEGRMLRQERVEAIAHAQAVVVDVVNHGIETLSRLRIRRT